MRLLNWISMPIMAAEYAWGAAYVGYNSITITKTSAIPATATSPAIPATTATVIKTGGIGGYGSPFANNSGCYAEAVPSFTTGWRNEEDPGAFCFSVCTFVFAEERAQAGNDETTPWCLRG